METVRSIFRMSYPYWEWIIVDDGSTEPQSLAQLAAVAASDDRIKVIRQANSGPSRARNIAVREAHGPYLLQLDSDDMVEPTFVEKSLWVMECQPQFDACSSYNVTFGVKQLLWDHGFQEYELNVTTENFVTSQAMIRRDAYLDVGGYDESITRGHEDWDFWLRLADGGHWGYTIPEYLTWYRNLPVSRRLETLTGTEAHKTFHLWLQKKHATLLRKFPRPVFQSGANAPHVAVPEGFPMSNPLAKKPGVRRVLLLAPWLVIGGADKFNLDLVRTLSRRGYEFTIATTRPSDNLWAPEFARLTPDIFMLPNFLQLADYPRFLSYLIDSRQIDVLLMSNSEFAYMLTPYLRAHHPNLPILDYTHVEEEWNNGGYPWMSVRMESQLDLSMTTTRHLKEWMIGRGATPDHIRAVHANIDTNEWNPLLYDTVAVRERLGIDADTAIVLYVGRIVDQKRPLLWAEIIRRLAQTEMDFIGLVVGDGDLSDTMKSFVQRHRLQGKIRFLGALPNKDVRELMAASDILLLPSKYEGLALVLYEAMCMQMAPVATDFGGHPELVTPECGYLISPSAREVEEYVGALQELLRNRERLARMALAGSGRVREHFTLEQMGDGVEAAFMQAGKTSAARPTTGIDVGLANTIAFSAIEYTRLTLVADRLWWENNTSQVRHALSLGDRVRLVRNRLLPIGSRRYETYKRIRRRLFPHAHYDDGDTFESQAPKPIVAQGTAKASAQAQPELLTLAEVANENTPVSEASEASEASEIGAQTVEPVAQPQPQLSAGEEAQASAAVSHLDVF